MDKTRASPKATPGTAGWTGLRKESFTQSAKGAKMEENRKQKALTTKGTKRREKLQKSFLAKGAKFQAHEMIMNHSCACEFLSGIGLDKTHASLDNQNRERFIAFTCDAKIEAPKTGTRCRTLWHQKKMAK